MWQQRSGLQDISNVSARHIGATGKPSEIPAGNPQLFLQMIEAAGVRGWTTPGNDGVYEAAAAPLEVVDSRRLRRYLESRLQRDTALRERWLEGLKEACEGEEVLYRALLPMMLAAPPSVGSGPPGGGAGGGGGGCGDSFLRSLLGVPCLQAPVATWLLQKLPVLAMAEPSVGSSTSIGGVPGLIVSQLRWLDVLPDVSSGGGGGGGGGSPLVEVVLEVLPLTPPGLQRQLIGLLPELAALDDHTRIVEKLGELLDSELGFVAPTLEALQQLQLGPDLQDQVVLDMVQRLPGVDSDDLPALVRFVIQYSTGPPSTGGPGGGVGARGGGGGGGIALSAAAATAPSVIAALRGGLPMVDLNDPRVSVLDPKGKRGSGSGQDPVEVRLLRELVVALAANDAAAGAVLRAISAASERVRANPGGSSAPDVDPSMADDGDDAAENVDAEAAGGGGGAIAAAALADGPSKLVPLDLWILLALLAGRRGKEADKILRTKISDGTANSAWLSNILMGHAASMKEVWSAVMDLAASLAGSRPSGGPLAAAAARLYAVMFASMGGSDNSLYRIEVLHALHSHLGSGVVEEVDTALAALALLAEGPLSRPSFGTAAAAAAAAAASTTGPPAPALAQYGSALSNCLDHLESFTDSQLARLFDVLAAVTGGAEGVAWRAAAEARSTAGGGAAGGRGSVVRIGGGAGGRLESEVQIVVDKALKGSASYKRIGIAGSMAFLRRVGRALVLLDSGGGRGSGGIDGFDILLREWRGRLDDLIAATEGHGTARALALTRIGDMLKAPAATATAPPPSSTADVALAGCWGAKLPAAALEQLTAVVQSELLEAALVVDLPLGAVQPGQDGDVVPPEVRVAGCARTFSCSVWLNVDEQETSVAINLWPLAASSAVADRDVLVWMAPCLSLVCLVSRIIFGDLQDVDGLLGCPLVMFPLELLQDEEGVNHLHELPPSVSSAVLTCLQAASSWLREVINCFSPIFSPHSTTTTTGQAWSQSGAAKLAKRAAQLAVMEALAASLLENVPPPRGGLAALQALRSHLDPLGRMQKRAMNAGGGAAAAAAAAGVKRGARAACGAAASRAAGATGMGTAASRAAAVLGFRRCIRSLSLNGTIQTLRQLLTSRPPGVYGGAADVGSQRQQPAVGCDGGGEDELVDPRHWGAWTVLPVRLSAAAYVMSELAAKAAVLAARAKNAPAFALSGPAAVAAADASLEHLTLGDLAATLAGMMPYIRKHLDSSTAALAGARTLAITNNIYLQPASDGDGQRLLAQLDAVQAPLEPSSTATHYVMDALDLLRIFFGAFVPLGGVGGVAAGRARGRSAASGGMLPPPPRMLAAALACLAAKPGVEGVPDAELKHLADAACPGVSGRTLSSSQAESMAQLAWNAFQQVVAQCQGVGPALPEELPGPTPENPPAPPDVWRELALLRTGRALINAVRHFAAPDSIPADWPDGLRRLAKAVSRSANKALENDWSGSGAAAAAGGGGGGGGVAEDDDGGVADDDGEVAAAGRGGGAAAAGGGSGGSFRWRGQAKLILELIKTYVDFSARPLEVLKLLVTQAIAEVPERRVGGGGRGTAAAAAAAASEPIAGYASLSDATLAAWYRGVFEALLERWTTTCSRMRVSERRVPGQDEEDELMVETVASAEVFSKLMDLVRKHPGRNPLITTAIKCGGKFIEDLARSTGAWRRLWGAHEDKLRRTVKNVQRGTRLLNTLCADGKERRSVALAAKVPTVKRAMETFLLNIRALFHEMGCAESIRIAQLKNKDIHGNEVPSQAYGGFDDDGDGGGYDDGAEEDDADEDGGGAGSAGHGGGRGTTTGKKGNSGGGGARGKRAAGAAAAGDGDGDGGGGGGRVAAAAPKVKKLRAAQPPKEDPPGAGELAAAAPPPPKTRKPRKPKAAAEGAAPAEAEGAHDAADASGGAEVMKHEDFPDADAGRSLPDKRTSKRPRMTEGSRGRKMKKASCEGDAVGDVGDVGGGGDILGGHAGGSRPGDSDVPDGEEGGEEREVNAPERGEAATEEDEGDMYGELHGRNRNGLYGNLHAEGEEGRDGEGEQQRRWRRRRGHPEAAKGGSDEEVVDVEAEEEDEEDDGAHGGDGGW